MAYAKRLTKDELIKAGITDITEDCRVFNEQREIFPRWTRSGKDSMYLTIEIYDLDADGNKIKIPMTRQFKYKRKDGTYQISKPTDTYVYKLRSIGLHRAMWAWHYGEVPEGLVVDHINNQHDKLEYYKLENLQLLTPKENVNKERVPSTTEMKCRLNKPRSFYEDKLNRYIERYEQAKLDKDSELCHKLRCNIAQCKARLRYWDSHSEEYSNFIENKENLETMKFEKTQDKRNFEILVYWKKVFKEAGNKEMWHQCCKVERMWKNGELTDQLKEHVINTLCGLQKKESL